MSIVVTVVVTIVVTIVASDAFTDNRDVVLIIFALTVYG